MKKSPMATSFQTSAEIGTNRSSPRDYRTKHKYNIFSRIFLCWIDPLLWLGCRHNLTFADLYPCPSEADSSYILEKFNRYWSAELQKRDHVPRLLFIWFKCFWLRVMLQGLLQFISMSINIAQSVLLGYLSDYFIIEEPSDDDTRNAYLFAMGITVLAFINALVLSMTWLLAYKLGILTRLMMTSAIYQKILTLSQTSIGQITVGQIVNLASNDVHKFELAFAYYHYTWISPIHTTVVTYLLYQELQWCAFIVTVLILIQIPVQLLLALLFSKLRLKAAKMTDRRLKVMNEVISGIRVIKMYGWEYAFRDVVAAIRKSEVYAIFKYFLVQCISLAYDSLSVPFIMFVVFSVYVSAFPGELTPGKVFTALSLITFLRITSIFNMTSFILKGSDAIVAGKRIKKFLLSKSSSSHPSLKYETNNASAVQLVNNKLTVVEEISASLEMNIDKLTSQNTISTSHDHKSSPMAIVDSVGCAKENVIQNLDELPSHNSNDSGVNSDDGIHLMSVTKSSEHMVVVENMSASWGMDDDKLTLQNISFTLDKNSLMAVVGSVGCGKSTLLQCILKELSPMSGSIQVNGSVSYASQEAWIFSATMRENILFGLPYDYEWYNAVIEACALDKDIEILPYGDLTIVGERGVTLSGGQKARVNLARAIYHEADVYLLDDPLSAVDAAVSRHIFEKCICGLLSEKCVILVTHQIQYLNQCDIILQLHEGSIGVYGEPKHVLQKNKNLFNLLKSNDSNSIEPLHHSGSQVNLDDVNIKGLSFSIDITKNSDKSLGNEEHGSNIDETTFTVGLSEEENAHGRISLKTYYQYFIAGGGYVFTGIVVLVFIFTEANIVISDWWISDWADCVTNGSNISTCYLSNSDRIVIYSSIIGTFMLFAVLRVVVFVMLMLNSSRVLHNRMFAKILRAPILFFDTNPIGRVLNRFSKDVGFLDDKLIQAFFDYLIFLTRFFAVMITASVANPYILIVVCGVFAGSLFLRWYFLKTARDIKRLEALARSPLYSHVSLTIQGLPTIRALSMTNEAIKQFHHFQNQHTQAAYLYIVANRWFCIRIDMIISLFIGIVSFVSIPLSSSFNAGLLGLSLTYAISLNDNFQYCLRMSGEVESSMVSAQRVMAYGKLETEANLESDPSIKPSSDWPSEGRIEIKDLSYNHYNGGPLVLRGVSCDIRPHENIGIVGRTGAGKSSLIGALFRLAEPQGCIKIDGIDISELGLHDVRSKLSIIPQDPILFGGTVRYNLDPFNQFDDEKIWTALCHVQLNSVVEGLEGQLDSIVNEGGSNFSVGQRQLFCLARALLRNNTILILDEATANVDLETDGIIQKVIREEFINCTTLTIAHRLDTVMDCDRIMILRVGEIIEFEEPHILLSDSTSYLSEIVHHTGPIAAQKLRDMALDAHNTRQNNVKD